MSSPADKNNSLKPRTRQSYAAPPILPPSNRFLPCPSFNSPNFSSKRPQERPLLPCNPNPFQPLSPSSTPTTKQPYAMPLTPPPLKTPFNIVASSFPPLTSPSPSNQSKDRPSTSQAQAQAPKEDHNVKLLKDSWNFILWIEREY